MKIYGKAEARELRKTGLSLKEIALKVGAAKSTVSMWVRDIELSEEVKNILKKRPHNGNKGAWVSVDRFNKIREANIQLGYDLAKNSENFRLLCAFYWSEGCKTRKYFTISNCDANLLKVVYKILKTLGIHEIALDICYHINNGISEAEINRYWLSYIPEIVEPIKFYKLIKNRTNNKTGKQPYGTTRLKVKKSSKLFYQIMGGIEYLKSQSD